MSPGKMMGIAIIVQETIFQGNSCPRVFCPMSQLSKQTIVQGDFCPMKHLPVKSLLTLIFLFLYGHLGEASLKKRENFGKTPKGGWGLKKQTKIPNFKPRGGVSIFQNCLNQNSMEGGGSTLYGALSQIFSFF